MPTFPDLSSPARAMPSSIFARLVDRLASHRGEIYPLHLGDTHLAPPESSILSRCPWDAEAESLYCYGKPAGDPALIEALVDKLTEKNRLAAEPRTLQITSGATHAFTCALRAVLDPGDEVLVCAPFWPLIRGQILATAAHPVEVPFSSKLYENPDASPRALLEPFLTRKTAAIYVTTPNNPDGKVLGERVLAEVGDFARRANLWVLSDEVYEDYAFDGRPHLSIGALPHMAERTISVFSFSKSYGQAGLRVGYMTGPAPVMEAVRKLSNHSVYNVPRAMQLAALAALRAPGDFLARASAEYRAARDETLPRLTMPHHAPEGASYVFVDLSQWLAPGEEATSVLEKLAGEGILLAPGYAFGKAYTAWARLCYTAMPRPKLAAGLDKLGRCLASLSRGASSG
jgi:N-succinyldiaminopimelate aminotransferase